MSTTTKIPYADACDCARGLVQLLRPTCERMLLAGSLRRQKAEIGDIELVVIPKLEPHADLFGEPRPSLARNLLDEALLDLGLAFRKDGPKFKQFTWEGMPVDLFIATADTWGCVATIRTGSADFSHWLVTPRRQGGGCPSHLRFSEGRIWQGTRAIDTPTEQDVFAALDQPWVEPVERIDGRWAK